MSENIKITLGKLERVIMAVLWEKGQGTVREVLDVLHKKKKILAYTTVMTVMIRLTEKRVLCREELPNGSFLYTPCFKREEFYAKTSRALLWDLVKNFGSVAVAQFVDVLEEVDPSQLQALRERLKGKKKGL